MAPAFPPARTASRLLGAAAVLVAIGATVALLTPDPLADVFFAAWVLCALGVTVVGGGAAWTGRTPLVWLAALLSTALSIVGMWSIGLYVAPSALLLLGAAILLQWAGPGTERRRATTTTRPPQSNRVPRMLGAVGAAAVGAWLVYAGSIAQDLFGACASETLACAVEKAHWGAIGLTAAGLLAVGLGTWLLWTQVQRARLAPSTQSE